MRLPPGQRRWWARCRGRPRLCHSTRAATSRAATAGYPDPRPRATEEGPVAAGSGPASDVADPAPAASARAMITVEELSKRYGGHRPVDRVSFQVRARVRHRLPRPQRGRQVDHVAHDDRPDPAVRRAQHHPRRAVRAAPQPGSARRRPARRLGAAHRTDRTRGPPARRHRDGAAPSADRRDARGRRPVRQRGRPPDRQLLPRHAAAARPRARPPRRPAGADPGRARQRARPGRHPLDAWPPQGRSPSAAGPSCCPRTCCTRSRSSPTT